MDDLNVQLLNPVSISVVGYADFYRAERGQLSAGISRQAHHGHPHLSGLLGSTNNVGGIAGGADGQENVAGAGQARQIAGKHVLVAVIVAYATHVAGIGDRHGSYGRPVVAESARKLLRKVHGIAQRTAVSATENTAPHSQLTNHQLCGRLNARKILGCRKRRQHSGGLGKVLLDERHDLDEISFEKGEAEP